MTNMKNDVVDAFKATLRGPVLQPGEPGYDDARAIWNAMIDRRPAFIARCSGTADVMAAVRFARANGLPLAVRGGGHNIAGSALCDDGLVIDLSGVQFLGSAGLAVLVETQKSARAREVSLRLIATTRAVTRPLEVTGLIDLFTIADSPAR